MSESKTNLLEAFISSGSFATLNLSVLFKRSCAHASRSNLLIVWNLMICLCKVGFSESMSKAVSKHLSAARYLSKVH